MHALAQNGADHSASIPELIDDRSLCFETDASANFVIDLDGVVRHANLAGRNMLRTGLLQLDGRERLCLARGRLRHARATTAMPLHAASATQVRQVSRTQWLVVTVRNIAGAPDALHVRAREIRLDEEIDLTAVTGELGISDSESPVLQGLAQAICPKEISRSLDLSIHTIRSHLRSIYAKLGVHTAAEAQLRVLQLYFVMKAIS